MAKSTNTVTTPEAFLLEVADLIIKTYGNSATHTAPAEPEDEPVEVEEVEAEEADSDSLEEEREELMALTLAEVRKRLIDAGFEAADVKKEKSKATLVDALLSDMYADEADEEEDDEEEEVEEDADEAEDEADDEDDEDDEDGDDEEDEDDESEYTEEELNEYSLAELKAIAEEWELDVKKGARSKAYITAILEAQEAAEDEDEDAEEEVDEEELREELEGLSLAALKKSAKDDYGLSAKDMKGLDKDAIIDLILEEDIEEEDEDEEDE